MLLRPALYIAVLHGIAACGPPQVIVSDAVAATPLVVGSPADASMAVYLTITNHGAADTLTGAESPIAKTATIHGGTDHAGMTAMAPQTVFVVPADATVSFRPGGIHLMLEGLSRIPLPGDTVLISLTFARAGRLAVAAGVTEYADLEAALDGPADR